MEYIGSLHNHTHRSNYRLRDCIIKEEELINYACELGHKVVAITDHETISSAVKIEKIYNKIKKEGKDIKVIMGNEIYLCRNDLSSQNFTRGQDKFYHFILLAKDREGFRQLCQLSTKAWKRSFVYGKMRRVPTYYSDMEEIVKNNKGHLIGSTACLGSWIDTQLLNYKETENPQIISNIVEWCNEVKQYFDEGDFYFELQPSASEEQTYVNRKLIELSQALNIPYIITTDSHYLKKEDRKIHEIFLKSQDGDREVESFYATTYLMSTEELENHLDLTREELDIAYENILKIKNKCQDYSILKPLNIPTLKWNNFEISDATIQEWTKVIPAFKPFLSSDYKGDKELVKATILGIMKHKDLQNKEAYKELNSNLEVTWKSSVTNKAHWSAYFLNLQKILDLCWEAGSIVMPGRGSGVGFVLLYALDIIQINKLREDTPMYAWRFLNPDRVSVLDIDTDIEGGEVRVKVLNKFREVYGEDRVANVMTLRTETTKSAILTCCRGLDIPIEEAQYISGLVPSDRGQLRSLSEVYYGNKNKGFAPVKEFVESMNQYPELWEACQKIGNLISGTGIHAGGVIFVDEPFYETTALMAAPDGTICTQFDLHDAEDVSLIKYDVLSVEAANKIHKCLDLLVADGIIEKGTTLRETYENTIGIYNLERDNPEMWKMIWEHKVLSLFQMEEKSGIQGIALIKPKSVAELAVLNSVIRLMAPDKNSEMPLETWAKYRKNINLWIDEMKAYGLPQKEIDWLVHHSAITDGICESQEGLMQLVQEEKLGHNTLTFADKVRKGIAKKEGKLFEECEKEFFETIDKTHCSPKLAHYVWDVLLRVQRGYSFNRSHCHAYSLVGLQEMNLAFRFPTIYWNCACLIVNSGIGDASTDYKKMAKAIGNIREDGTALSLVDINSSNFEFTPDVKNNLILFGMKGLNKCGDDVVNTIITNRPYKSLKDFLNKCQFTKTVVLSLIKAGAFDNLEEWADKYGDNKRKAIMAEYIMSIADTKKKLNLQNYNTLLNRGLIPDDMAFQKLAHQFNKYLKTTAVGEYYDLSGEGALEFYKQCEPDCKNLNLINGVPYIEKKKWDKLYKTIMDIMREWLKVEQQPLLKKVNDYAIEMEWNKYASGTLSAWEMESLCFYYHPHELANINKMKYGVSEFKDIEIKKVDKFFKRSGKNIPLYKLYKIIGTVIGKDTNKSAVYLLTTSGVVTINFSKEYFSLFNKRISEFNPITNKKEIKEHSWFQRGNMIMVTGYKTDDSSFRGKTYKNTAGHQLYKITEVINNGEDFLITHDRYNGGELEEDDEK